MAQPDQTTYVLVMACRVHYIQLCDFSTPALVGLSDEDREEAEKVRRWRHNIQRELLPSDRHLQRRGPLSIEVRSGILFCSAELGRLCVPMYFQTARPVDIWFKEIEAYEKMSLPYLTVRRGFLAVYSSADSYRSTRISAKSCAMLRT